MQNNHPIITKKTIVVASVIFGIFCIVAIILAVINNSNNTTPDYSNEPAELQIAKGNAEREKWPVITKLPIKNSLFTIGYIVDEQENLTINITASETYIDMAINKLKKLDSELSKYNIKIKDFDNPFDIELQASTTTTPSDFLREVLSNATTDFAIKADTISGDYYCAAITTGSEETYNLVTYHAILKKTNNSWILVSTPYPILTTTNTPDTPSDILNLTNNL